MKRFIMLVFMLLVSSPLMANQLWEKNNTVYIASSVGGTNDLVTRIVLGKVAKNTNSTIVFVNNNQASGIAVSRFIANAAPDRIWLSNFSQYTTIVSYFPEKIEYEKLTGVAVFSTTPLVLAANKQFSSLEDLKRSDRKLFKGCVGTGSPGCVYNDILSRKLELQTQNVSHANTGFMATELARGSLDFYFNPLNNVKSFALSKDINLIAVTGSESRFGLPTLKDLGYPDLQMSYWTGILTNKETNPEHIIEMEKQIKIALQDDEVKQAITKIDVEVLFIGKEKFNQIISKELEEYRNIGD